MPESIRIRGARTNNLKNIDVDFPLGKLTVVTGLSGTGKSSLVFDCLYAEGNRRYVETFSPYTRQFLDLMDRPKVDTIENIRPSIAVEQGSSIKTSRSTVGTMTELCDFFKVWFSHAATLYDPKSGDVITEDNPSSIWKTTLARFSGVTLLLTFTIRRPGKLTWEEVLKPLAAQGYTRVILEGKLTRLEALSPTSMLPETRLSIIQDRLTVAPKEEARFLDACRTALKFGEGQVQLYSPQGKQLDAFSEGLHVPGSDEVFRPATPNLFSFNSPLGACPECRGFGRIIEIDDRLIIPDHTLSLEEGAVRAFSGAVYSNSLTDLLRGCRKEGVRTKVPWNKLRAKEKAYVLEGDSRFADTANGRRYWYGVRRFFKWLEDNTYKMHVRVFLSRYRAYVPCPSCGGQRLQPESLLWKWNGYTLPDLYHLPVSELSGLMTSVKGVATHRPSHLALEAIRTRLNFLQSVGLGYLTLNRSSRTLSGGETQRVNLTTCLGTALVDTLYILDEPSIGLHCSDIDRLIRILRQLTAQGNTVVVVEHDEAIIAASDHIIEMGPLPGKSGGEVIFRGRLSQLLKRKSSPTGRSLSGGDKLPNHQPRPVGPANAFLRLRKVEKHNLKAVDVDLPLERFVVLTGLSGSGKSTLLVNGLHQGLLNWQGKACEDPARVRSIELDHGFSECILVDQSPVSKTPRSNPALFVGAWDPIRQLIATTPEAQKYGFTASAFSFNSGPGRCPRCQGLGYERVEMQFMADIFVECPLCEGRQFRDEVLEVQWQGHSVHEILQLTVAEALGLFAEARVICARLQGLAEVGLDYLPLGQPLNTLSGGESQRLKLVRFLGSLGKKTDQALLLLDEPTTGLHKADVVKLLDALQRLVEQGHSLVLIEHHPDVIRSADWIIELGPGAGDAGGEITFTGTPGQLLHSESPTAPFIAEDKAPYTVGHPQTKLPKKSRRKPVLELIGAREHNLKDLSLEIPRNQFTVVTGVSGSGKSTLAFDIIFAEGQRRFLESMSSWARQYVEQLPKPEVDQISGLQPTVAIEQRVTQGTRKSTVATVTEVAQYLRLLYARIGIQHSPVTGEPLIALDQGTLEGKVSAFLKAASNSRSQSCIHFVTSIVRNRKGHHQPVADWAKDHGYKKLRVDGQWVPVDTFQKLDRYREHSLELVVASIEGFAGKRPLLRSFSGEQISLSVAVSRALETGRGVFALIGEHPGAEPFWFSKEKADPNTGLAFPDLDPKDFSFNAPRGWCPACHGYGRLYEWMQADEAYTELPETFAEEQMCPRCHGERLNEVSRSVFLHFTDKSRCNLPQLLKLAPAALLRRLTELELDARGKAILGELLPEIEERLSFLGAVGLDYLALDRSAVTLSGGEAQRIRLAAQLGTNLAGALYVLDEPSIGLHEQDNERLIGSLQRLRDKGNSLLVVEHDLRTMEAADHIIDLGPGAGHHGGELLAQGPLMKIRKDPKSSTGSYLNTGLSHPSRGKYRPLPAPYNPRSTKSREEWMLLRNASLRNLKGLDVAFPLARLIAVCGVSGAGKSTLVRDALLPAVRTSLEKGLPEIKGKPALEGFSAFRCGRPFEAVIEVDQSPIGKTPRSTPATYIGAFDRIRKLYASTPEARVHGLPASHFSFNTKGGRCETCKGAGRIKLEMAFLPDTYTDCDDCMGRRYAPVLEEIQWNGASIADVLEMSFEEAATFFSFDSYLHQLLNLMVEAGLGYLTLGQSSPTLSGGEAQRLKLVSELARGLSSRISKRSAAQPACLYLLEEPTIGLHMADCERLLRLLHRLVDEGHTVILIEHHLDLIADADYLIEMGPAGGEKGGQLLFQGPPSGLVNHQPSTPTAPYLKPLI
jgi:excinuclease ABC subunit A